MFNGSKLGFYKTRFNDTDISPYDSTQETITRKL